MESETKADLNLAARYGQMAPADWWAELLLKVKRLRATGASPQEYEVMARRLQECLTATVENLHGQMAEWRTLAQNCRRQEPIASANPPEPGTPPET